MTLNITNSKAINQRATRLNHAGKKQNTDIDIPYTRVHLYDFSNERPWKVNVLRSLGHSQLRTP